MANPEMYPMSDSKPAVRFGDWMSDYDAGLWHSERDPRLRSTILSVWLLDRKPEDGDFEAMLAASVEDIPRLRQRVVQDAFELAPPRWEIDPNFDPAYHLRKLTLGGSGTLRDLLDLAEPIAMQAFDKDRPLWEFYLVDGLEGGRAGAIMKLHHTVSDGVGLVRMTKSMVERDREAAKDGRPRRRLADLPEPEARDATDRIRDALAHRVEVEAERVGRFAKGALRWFGSLVSDPVATVEGVREMAGSVGRLLRPINEPMSPVMLERGMGLALDAFTVPLEELKRAALAAGGSVNDVFVAAVAGGMRFYHEHHGKPVDELQMMMPINLRDDGDKSAVAGNQFAPSRFLVPVSCVDPRERVATIQERVREQRREPALPYIDEVTGVMNRLPRAAMASLMEGMVTSIDFVTSNVPGPRRPVYTAGAKIEHMFPFGPPAGAAVNITLFSYDGICHLGVNADRSAVTDPELLVECLKKGLDEMLAL
jgi:WS/DGAT/MGAT family acyltransferase